MTKKQILIDEAVVRQAQMYFNMIATGNNLDWIKHQAGQQSEALRQALEQPVAQIDTSAERVEKSAENKHMPAPAQWGVHQQIALNKMLEQPAHRFASWPSIETAPKLGEICVAKEFSPGRWTFNHAWWNPETEEWQDEFGDFVLTPTHWMPIPSPHNIKEQPAPAREQDIPDLIAGALGVSRGTAYDLMREALAEQPAQQEPVADKHQAFIDSLPSDMEDKMFEQIHYWARQSYARHQRSTRGQTITAADSSDNHIIWAALRWAKENAATPQAPAQPLTFEEWLAKQNGDPEEIGFLQALRIAYIDGQDSITKENT